MSLRPFLPWLLLAGALTVAAMVLGAGRGDKLTPAVAAALFALLIVAAALWLNSPLWRGASREMGEVKDALASNVWLVVFVYAWGATALYAVYSLSDVVWRHAWQYGLGAALVAAGVAIYALRIEQERARPPPLSLTVLHGLAVSAGLVYLVGSGKLATTRGDWVANDIFLAGGIAIVALCVIAAVTQTRASR
jgi:hypothetical protein